MTKSIELKNHSTDECGSLKLSSNGWFTGSSNNSGSFTEDYDDNLSLDEAEAYAIRKLKDYIGEEEFKNLESG